MGLTVAPVTPQRFNCRRGRRLYRARLPRLGLPTARNRLSRALLGSGKTQSVLWALYMKHSDGARASTSTVISTHDR